MSNEEPIPTAMVVSKRFSMLLVGRGPVINAFLSCAS